MGFPYLWDHLFIGPLWEPRIIQEVCKLYGAEVSKVSSSSFPLFAFSLSFQNCLLLLEGMCASDFVLERVEHWLPGDQIWSQKGPSHYIACFIIRGLSIGHWAQSGLPSLAYWNGLMDFIMVLQLSDWGNLVWGHCVHINQRQCIMSNSLPYQYKLVTT